MSKRLLVPWIGRWLPNSVPSRLSEEKILADESFPRSFANCAGIAVRSISYTVALRELGEAMFQPGYIEPVKVTIRSSRTIIFTSEDQIRCLRANFHGGLCAILLG